MADYRLPLPPKTELAQLFKDVIIKIHTGPMPVTPYEDSDWSCVARVKYPFNKLQFVQKCQL